MLHHIRSYLFVFLYKLKTKAFAALYISIQSQNILRQNFMYDTTQATFHRLGYLCVLSLQTLFNPLQRELKLYPHKHLRPISIKSKRVKNSRSVIKAAHTVIILKINFGYRRYCRRLDYIFV